MENIIKLRKNVVASDLIIKDRSLINLWFVVGFDVKWAFWLLKYKITYKFVNVFYLIECSSTCKIYACITNLFQTISTLLVCFAGFKFKSFKSFKLLALMNFAVRRKFFCITLSWSASRLFKSRYDFSFFLPFYKFYKAYICVKFCTLFKNNHVLNKCTLIHNCIPYHLKLGCQIFFLC